MDSVIGHLDGVVGFVQEHKGWAAPVILLLAFGESLALVSLLFPATVILFGIGALIGAGGLEFWPLWAAAAVGAQPVLYGLNKDLKSLMAMMKMDKLFKVVDSQADLAKLTGK